MNKNKLLFLVFCLGSHMLHAKAYEVIIVNNGIMNFQKEYMEKFMKLAVTNKQSVEKLEIKNSEYILLLKKNMSKLQFYSFQ